MIRKVFVLLTICLASSAYAKQLKIVTSITPLASLASMIVDDVAEISSITNDAGCPHHHTLKPSDIKRFNDADLFIYIDDKFDNFVVTILPQVRGQVLRVSNLRGLKIENGNWHLWLLPQNAITILENITDLLCQLLPEKKSIFEHNLALHLEKMNQLELRRLNAMHNIHKAIVLSDSAQYLFLDSDTRYEKFYKNYEHLSVKATSILSNLVKEKYTCFISDTQNLLGYRKLLGQDAKLVGINTENWIVSDTLNLLYYKEYDGILDAIINKCKK
jgi:zinc transport system substrate-binding protein